MSPRTLCPPPSDRGMWRRLLKAPHPDTIGDDGALFVWTRELQAYIAGDRTEEPPFSYAARARPSEPPKHPPRTDGRDRIAFGPDDSFTDLTRKALRLAEELDDPYRTLLLLLSDCVEASPSDPMLWRQQQRGCSYKQLAAIAYRAGMSYSERITWYRLAEAVPLSMRHAGHLMSRIST